MAGRQRRRLAVIARHLEPEGDDTITTRRAATLTSSDCAAQCTLSETTLDSLAFNSLSATTLNALNANRNTLNANTTSSASLKLNSLSATTLNTLNANATTVSSLAFNSLTAETLNTLNANYSGARLIPVVDRHLSTRARKSSSYERVHESVSRDIPAWVPVPLPAGQEFEDILYEKAASDGIAKITISRPERRNAFTPSTVAELKRAFDLARDDTQVGVIVFTGTEAFCRGDQAVRGKHGYVGDDNSGRLNIRDVQMQIRRLQKPVIAMVAGYAVEGGHVLHMPCDLTTAAENAVFGQTAPKVGSFDDGYGCSMMARLVGQKKAREMWFRARFYSAEEADKKGLIRKAVGPEKREEEAVIWSREMLRKSPMAVPLCKLALHAVEDGLVELQEFAGNKTSLFCNSEEGQEGKTACLDVRPPDFYIEHML